MLYDEAKGTGIWENAMSEEIFVDSKITQWGSKAAIVNPIIESRVKESNHIEESYIKPIQDLDILYGGIVNHKDEELTNFNVALEIKQSENILGEDDSYYILTVNKIFDTSVGFETTLNFMLVEESMQKDLILY